MSSGKLRSLLSIVCLGLCASPAVWALEEYSQDFEALDAGNPDALALDSWLVAGLVFDEAANFKFFYGNFPAPNGGPSFSGLTTGQGGPPQGAQQLSVYSDYNCCTEGGENEGHFNGTDLVQSNVFQEQTVAADDVGKLYTFRFDGKAGDLAGSTTALGFIQTLDPDDGFATTNFVSVDTTDLPDTWGSYAVSLLIDDSLVGQILQFGFSSVTSNFEASQMVYDNVSFLAQQIGGTATQIDGNFAGCIERGNPPLTAAPPDGTGTWDCTAAGFLAEANAIVVTLITGTADCGSPGAVCDNIGATIDGLFGVRARCANLATGQQVSFGPLLGATSVDCTANGLLAEDGAPVSIQFVGLAE